MSTISVTAPIPWHIGLSPAVERTEVLQRRVMARGMCVRATLAPDNDPWYPAAETGAKAAKAARAACQGCTVTASCLELALREESQLGNVHGVRGGLACDERLALLRTRRVGDSR